MADTPIKRGRGRPPKNLVSITQSDDSSNGAHPIIVTKAQLKKWMVVVAGAVVLIGVGFLVWQYVVARNDVKRLSDPKNASQAANDDVIKKVAKIAVVPSNEKPTVADVSDASKLKGQPLFDQIQNGDKVLLYAQARREVVYRPSTNQIITIVTLPAQDSSATTPAQ